MGDIKRVAVLGSTGSIGRQTLEVISAHPKYFRIVGLAAGKNLDLLTKQISQFKPKFVYSQDKKANLPGNKGEFLSLEEMASHPEVDMVVMATSGKWGLKPTLAAVRAAKRIALANKESLVMAGEIIIAEAKQKGAKILPVDSEHSAIWQCLEGEKEKPAKIILTASGGPFYKYSPDKLDKVTVEQALKHPSWRMGKKVTIDSATLMNKGLEVIEAHWLFGIPVDSIDVLVHPQSIIHSLVEFTDGSVKAQLGCPDMRLPIQYALSYPERLPNAKLPRLDWQGIEELTFAPPDLDSFPCLKLAIEAGRKGGTYPAVLCGADEVAVELFLAGRIKFTDIAKLVKPVLAGHKAISHPTLEEILAADEWAREETKRLAGGAKR
jgi:1-deoxy-D-xylulose-5-phosphate reductoisomerase